MSNSNQLVLQISDKLLQDTKDSIKRRIIQKLAAARKLIDFDKEVSAGIYVYAVEELGKMEVLKNVQDRKLPYWTVFRDHNTKFDKAKEYLKNEKHLECFLLNEGDFDSNAFDSDDFVTDVAADTEARLGIFYVDLKYNSTNRVVTGIKGIPTVDAKLLSDCIDSLEKIVNNWN
jgi:hypothetical protein